MKYKVNVSCPEHRHLDYDEYIVNIGNDGIEFVCDIGDCGFICAAEFEELPEVET